MSRTKAALVDHIFETAFDIDYHRWNEDLAKFRELERSDQLIARDMQDFIGSVALAAKHRYTRGIGNVYDLHSKSVPPEPQNIDYDLVVSYDPALRYSFLTFWGQDTRNNILTGYRLNFMDDQANPDAITASLTRMNSLNGSAENYVNINEQTISMAALINIAKRMQSYYHATYEHAILADDATPASTVFGPAALDQFQPHPAFAQQLHD